VLRLFTNALKERRVVYIKHIFAGFCLLILSLSVATSAFAQNPLSKEDAFIADNHPEVKAIFEGREDSKEILDALTDAGGNWRNLFDAVANFDGDKREDCIFLVKIMPHLDRLEMTKEILIEHVDYGWAAKTDFPYKVPEDMFREYILVYRLGDEPVTPYRALMRERFGDLVGQSPVDTAKAVNKWIYENSKVKERGFFGPRPSPVNVLNAGAGTEEDIANLTAAILKTLGVPSRRASIANFSQQAGGASWVEIYDGKWIPLYPDSPEDFGDLNRWERNKPRNITVVIAQSAFHTAQVTQSYTETGTIEMKFFRHGEVQPKFEHFGISVYNNGAWNPLDDLGFDLEGEKLSTSEKDVFDAVLGDGLYLVECGVRNYKGDPWVQTKMVELNPGGKINLEFNLDPPLEDLTAQDLQRRTIKPLPQFTLGEVHYPADMLGKPHLLVFFNLKNEPSIRMLPDIIRFANDNPGLGFLLIHSGEPDEKDDVRKAVEAAGGDSSKILWDDSGDVALSWQCPRDENGKFTAFPASILINAKSEAVLYDEGLNLIIYELLEKGMGFVSGP